jgi:hypothetical protein
VASALDALPFSEHSFQRILRTLYPRRAPWELNDAPTGIPATSPQEAIHEAIQIEKTEQAPFALSASTVMHSHNHA